MGFRVAGNQLGTRSVAVGRNDLAAVATAQSLPGCDVDGVLDEPDRAVGQQRVDAAGVLASRGDVQ